MRPEPRPRPTVRIVHLGLGAFHRAHQAWYTDRASDREHWGIAAFTGRTPEAALQLAAQDGLYTLIERAADGDSASIVASIVEAVDGSNLERLVTLLSSSSTALVTMTVTEAGYRLDPGDDPDRPRTTLGRLLLGLDARCRADAGPIAIVPCDNVPDNGAFVAGELTAMAAERDAALAAWIDRNVSFVSTSVDRITPRTTPEDVEVAAELTGWHDAVPVVTEPFSDWLLCGEFPAGRPAWESAGARFVHEIEPFERRKLWLLNGGHSLLAYAGLRLGHDTVAEAINDPRCLRLVDAYWDEAARHLPAAGLDLDAYRAALLERFTNPRIGYPLRQIATDGVAKLRARIVPVVLAERAAGRNASASLPALGAWLALTLHGAGFKDAESAAIDAALAGPAAAAIDELVRLVEPRLLDDRTLIVKSLDEVSAIR
jgi:fructuronate reductase